MHDIIRRICTLGWSIKRRAIDKRPSLIFGVGLPKTGTTSIAYLLGPERHGYHEKNRARSINVIRLYCSGDINIGRLERWFVIRDIYLYPVFDIAHYYGAIADEMVGLFPNSKFLITLRDCYSWAQSFGNQVIKRWRWKNGWSEDCEDYLVKWQKYQFGHPGAWSYPSPESELQEVGMPPLSVLYQYYRGRNRKLLDAIPPDRRIVLKTSELSQSISRIEHFAELPEGTLYAERSHARQRACTFIDLFEEVPLDHLEKVAQRYCSGIMDRWFPEIQGPMDVRK